MILRTLLDRATALPAAPWLRLLLAPADWAMLPAALLAAPDWRLEAQWADPTTLHALLRDPAGIACPISVPITQGSYAPLSPARPAASWFERMIRDLWGHVPAPADPAADILPLLDHGNWACTRPLASHPGPQPPPALPPDLHMLTPEEADAGLMQWPLGPVPTQPGAPTHLRVTLAGRQVAHVAGWPGYGHSGVLALLRGKSPRNAARFAARLGAETTVGHAIAFASAAEAVQEAQPPPRALALRSIMATLEALITDLAVLEALLRIAGPLSLAAALSAQHGGLRQAALLAFGHRLMLDGVVPGGVAADLAPDGPAAILAALAALEAALPEYAGLASRDDLAGIGPVTPADIAAYGADARLVGDVAARLCARAASLPGHAAQLRALLGALPDGAIFNRPPGGGIAAIHGEGFGHATSAQGDIWHWLRLEGGLITDGFLCDPAWRHWPLALHAATGARADDLDLILASFGRRSPGLDL